MLPILRRKLFINFIMEDLDLKENTNTIIELVQTYVLPIVYAIVILIVGLFIIKQISKLVEKALDKRHADPTIKPFIINLVGFLLKVLLVIIIAGMVGIETASLVAVIGALGLAVGLALQGSLGNFAGGVLILFFKPFKVGHVIEAQGFTAIVNEIQVFHTVLKSFDNKTIILPNGPLANSSITNYSVEEKRRCDMSFGIGYSDDIDKAKKIIRDTIFTDARVLNEPAEPFLVVGELGDSSVNLTVRVWLNAADYWPLYFEMQEKIKKEFDANGVSIPFPQRDVDIDNETSA